MRVIPIRVFLILCTIALASGCSTIQGRIEDRRAAFESFPPEVQKNVRQGKIKVGYTKDMVYIAKGSPDEIQSRETDAGTTTVWSYTRNIYPRTHIGLHYGTYGPYGPDYRHGFHHHTGFWWNDYGERSYEYLRIEWDGDRVKAIERTQRRRP